MKASWIKMDRTIPTRTLIRNSSISALGPTEVEKDNFMTHYTIHIILK